MQLVSEGEHLREGEGVDVGVSGDGEEVGGVGVRGYGQESEKKRARREDASHGEASDADC
jgi:hypothetical protein